MPTVSPRRALIAFSLGTLFFGYAFIQRVAPSIMTSELMRDFAVSGAALGSLSAFYFWTYAAIQLPVGMLTDRFGPRKLMSVTALICAVAALGFALSHSLLMASFWRAVIGGTVAFAFVGTLAIIGYWFRSAVHALLVGLLQTVGMLGAVFTQGLLRPVVETSGWRFTMGWLSVIAVILAIALFFLVPHRSSVRTRNTGQVSVFEGFTAVINNRQTWYCALIGFGAASTMLAFSGLWAVPWLSTVHGYSTNQAARITTVLFLGWAMFAPLTGWCSDHIGLRNPIMVLGMGVYFAAMVIMIYWTPGSATMLMLLMFMLGAAGSVMTIAFVAVREHNSPQYSSTSVGLMNMFVVGAGAVMQPLIGWLLDRNWDGALLNGAPVYSAEAYTIALSSLLVVNAAALAGTVLLRETRCHQQID